MAPPDMQAFAFGLATWSALQPDKLLDVWYPAVNCGEAEVVAAQAAEVVPGEATGTAELTGDVLAELIGRLEPLATGDGPHPNLGALRVLHRGLAAARPPTRVRTAPVLTRVESLARPPLDAADVYLRLHLLSHRRVRPRELNLDGVFALLQNVAWTSMGPCDPEDFEQQRLELRAAGHHVTVAGVDKFPRMVDYVVPSGVRIADADRVRLGAHLGVGTTVMHEGFVNFNAGTLGEAMVEGRISAGVVVGDRTDLGGGSSIMGTLSGGGTEVISVGEQCLLGANAGIGISLGDRCTVEAGLYVTAGTRVTLPGGAVVKARELSGRSDLLFRRNSTSGAVEALAASGTWQGLNADLHSNN